MLAYCFLTLAICVETLATTLLAKSNGFSHPGYGVFSLILYGISLVLLSLTLKTIPVGVAYALWAGIGIVLVSCAGFFVLHQKLSAPTLLGITLIIIGTAIIHLSGDTTHTG